MPLRRGVVHARVSVTDFGLIDVLVCHFKSQRSVPGRDSAGEVVPAQSAAARAEGELRSLVWRAAEALFVVSIMMELRR